MVFLTILVAYVLSLLVVCLIAIVIVKVASLKELSNCRSTIANFENFLAQLPICPGGDSWAVFDENRLPFSKKDIFDSYVIVRRTKPNISAVEIEAMKFALLRLSCFQKDVGNEPVVNPLASFRLDRSRVNDSDYVMAVLKQAGSLEPKMKRYTDLQTLSLAEARVFLDIIGAEKPMLHQEVWTPELARWAPKLKCESNKLYYYAECVLLLNWSYIIAVPITAVSVAIYLGLVGFD